VGPSRENLSGPLPPGRVIGHYIVQQQIGAGSGGVVYRALDHRMQRAVAVKVLDPCLPGAEANWVLAASEARAAGSLAHPNICTVFDVEEEDGRVYIAMELIEGRSLHAATPGHGLSSDAVARYGAQIARALGHAHDKGVCHSDVSARNVMLTLDDRVKVLDFGLARLLARSGSPAVISEGARRDLQQLGVLLCQIATGAFPPQAFDVLNGTAPPSTILESSPVAALPKGLWSVIARCLDPDPSRSYQRAQQAAEDLEAEAHVARKRPSGSARMITWRRATLAAAAVLLAALLVIVPLSIRKAGGRGAGPGAVKPVPETPAKKLPAKQPAATARPDARVWANTKSKVYHCGNSALYGKTLKGNYMTQQQALAAGYRPARKEFCQ
jgi:eukaryotic-like serine/threonine-protein kinase